MKYLLACLLAISFNAYALTPDGEIIVVCTGMSNASQQCEKFRKHHNVNGNDMKFSDLKNLKLDIGWKTQITKGDLAYFERRAGRLNRQFGYQ